HGIDMIPFFIYYSMFGFQRIGDLIWAGADQRMRGFLLGATAGRTTLNGEGLQHEDGHSLVLASVIPTLQAYDPAFAFEIAVIIRDGLERMFEKREDIFYYLTLYNENYPMPPKPAGVDEGILKGLYKLKDAPTPPEGASAERPQVHLFGSGTILNSALRAQEILAERYGVAATVWSATSYKQLRADALEADRWNLLHPEEEPRKPYVVSLFEGDQAAIVAVSNYMKLVPDQIARWLPGRFYALGTDGFGRSETREALRRFFEIDAESVVLAALWQLAQQGRYDREAVRRAIGELGIDPEKAYALIS
ncbi:MAG: pyruvate dehydrogenase (acetyl-transferring), homodimeric type, partial [Acidobacteriota bacterium]